MVHEKGIAINCSEVSFTNSQKLANEQYPALLFSNLIILLSELWDWHHPTIPPTPSLTKILPPSWSYFATYMYLSNLCADSIAIMYSTDREKWSDMNVMQDTSLFYQAMVV